MGAAHHAQVEAVGGAHRTRLRKPYTTEVLELVNIGTTTHIGPASIQVCLFTPSLDKPIDVHFGVDNLARAFMRMCNQTHPSTLRRGTEVREQSEFVTRWIKDTLPANFRGGVIFVDSPDPNHPKAHRLSRRRLHGISNDNKELHEKILDDLHNGSINIEQAAEVVRMHGAEHYIRVCATQDDLISTIDQILDSGDDCWGSGGKSAWDDHGYFVNTFWRE